MSFEPKYTITTKLLQNIKKIAVLIDGLNSRSLSKIVFAKLEKASREISTYASTSIEGNPLPLTEVKKILKNTPENLRDTEREIVNYNNAMQKANDYIPTKKAPSLKLILDIHKTVEDGLLDNFRLGKLRKEPVFVNDPKSRKPIYLPPDHQDVPKLMEDLIDYIEDNFNELDPLILAGLFHKQFVIIHPFIDGNGETARLITKIILALLGINTFKLFSFENYYNNDVTKYFKKVGSSGNYYELKNKLDYTEWLEYFTDGIIDELMRINKELSKAVATPKNELQEYHKKILTYIKENGYITDKIYANLTERAKPTRNQDFRKLISLGLIKSEGKGKATYYKLI